MTHGRLVSLAAAIALSVPVPLAAQADTYDSGGPLIPEQAAYDVTFYDLVLAVHPSDSSIEGSLTAVARALAPLKHFVLDLDPLLQVRSVTQSQPGHGSVALDYERRAGKLWIELPDPVGSNETVTVTVDYGGKPRPAPNAPWSGGFSWSRTPGLEPWIATTCQQEGPDIWWPSKDHPSDEPDSMALHITVPAPLVVASNGHLVGVDSHDDSTVTWNWFVSTPINGYDVALNIAPYRTIEERYTSVSGETFPVIFWVLPENYDRGRRLMTEIMEHLRFYEEVAGPYPFRADKYGVVETPHLGMEHQTIIAYGGRFQNGAMTGGVDWGFDALHHHELAHEWFGNVMTNADWKDMWLHEGFGTYMQPLYLERSQGIDAARAYLASLRDNIENRRPVAPRASQTAKQIYGGDIYFKGAWVLHTLRFLIGDAAFFRAVRRLAYPDPAMERVTTGEQTHFATTDDFIAIAEREAGTDLDWFFEVYLRQPKLPRLETRLSGDTLTLWWETPDDLAFTLPVEIQVDSETMRIPMPGGRGRIALSGGTAVAIDPNGWILMERAPDSD